MPKPPKVIGMGAANSGLKLRILFGNCNDKVRTFWEAHIIKKISSSWFWRLLSKSAGLSKPWGRFFQILCVSLKVQTLAKLYCRRGLMLMTEKIICLTAIENYLTLIFILPVPYSSGELIKLLYSQVLNNKRP